MKSAESFRMRSYSEGWGSLTFKMRSAVPQTSAAELEIWQPALRYESSLYPLPIPAPVWIRIWLRLVSSLALSGVTDTRFSPVLISLGIPNSNFLSSIKICLSNLIVNITDQ